MHAYAPNGSLIVQSRDSLFASADLEEGGFTIQDDGSITNSGSGGSTMDWDSQKQVVIRGEPMWMCEDGDEWPSCSLILLENERGTVEDEDSNQYGDPEPFPPEMLAKATAAYDAWVAADATAAPVHSSRGYEIDMPANGWRSRESFTAEEKARLRPVAEVLALLDGNAFFGMDVDESGDDRHYENYLPEAAAIAEANNGWFDLTSFVRGARPLPANPMGLDLSDRAEGRVDLASGDLVTVRISGIEWDASIADGSEESAVSHGADLSPLLPPDLVVGVPVDWSEGDRLATLLGDHYGFRVLSIGSSGTVED